MSWRGLSPRRRVLSAAIAAVVLVIGLVVAFRAVGTENNRAGPAAVVLIPGYGGNQSSLDTLAERIRATGRQAEVLTLPGDGTGDLLAQVAVLDNAVRQLNSSDVDVIGYSAGGVVARLWIARDDGAARARRVITLGSPLHGTQLAAAGGIVAPDACPTACQQLIPGSALLGPLDAQPLPAGLSWLSIWTEDDQTVTPPASARLAGAVNVPLQQVCPNKQVSHGQLPTDPLVTRLVMRALGPGPLAGPSPSDCMASS